MSGITPLPPPPSTSDPSNFSTRADDFLAALPTFATEANDLAAALNNISTTSTSTTSNTIGTGSKAFTVQTGKSYFPGQSVTIARTSSPTNRMFAVVASYNNGTGALVVTSQAFEGSGTFTDWTITLGFNGIISAGQIANGAVTNAKLNADAKFGRLLNIQTFTSSGTYTPTTGTRAVEVEVIGGGGGGGGSDNTNQQAGGGGGGGGYSYKFITSGLGATEPVTIGAGGANGGTTSSGSAGGTSSFGSHCSASGGGAGSVGSSTGSLASGGTGTGGDINIAGGAGAPAGQIYAPRNSEGGHAPRGYGIGGKTSPNISGNAGLGYGAGGAGGWRINSNASGGSGKAGIVIVKEYA